MDCLLPNDLSQNLNPGLSYSEVCLGLRIAVAMRGLSAMVGTLRHHCVGDPPSLDWRYQ